MTRLKPLLRRAAGTLALAALWPTPAVAQIYTWRDGHGHLVLSDRPARDGAAMQSYPVPGAEEIGTTRAAIAGTSGDFGDIIDEHARLHNVRPALVRAVVQTESGFNPFAVSPKGAMGLMQLMPATAQDLGVVNPFNPVENVRGGVAYLRRLLDRYDNDERLALAAYNAGPEAVRRHGGSIPPYRETREYVSRVRDLAGQSRPVGQPRQVEPAQPATRIYKTTEMIDGREVVHYTNRRP
jgi:hypothetical protein